MGRVGTSWWDLANSPRGVEAVCSRALSPALRSHQGAFSEYTALGSPLGPLNATFRGWSPETFSVETLPR